ncbi:MAG: hypothetical protein KJO55_02145 [Gammaproteobacteria bacterium]|nr:hypothetical protein [Gammaproteobacteria bacterium]NND59987.1 hypothetical protein [Gammaproteobacteria bacterium]
MSLVHLQAFVEDLKTTNPRFNESRSSLQGLLQHLHETAVGKAKPFASVAQAKAKCRNVADRRLAKYDAALGRLVKVWGKGAMAYPLEGNLQQVDINRVCFRGDSRGPGEIFATGFTKRTPTMAATYRGYKVNSGLSARKDPARDPIGGFSKAGDLDPASAVCVTPSMDVAALFPLPGKWDLVEKPIWIYLVYVTKGYNTNLRQILDALGGLAALAKFEATEAPGVHSKAVLHNVRINEIQQNLYGREMAADTIDKKHIFAGIEIIRTWNSDRIELNGSRQQVRKVDYKQAGNYKVQSIRTNAAAEYPKGYEETIKSFLVKIESDTAARTMPTHADGFAKSSPGSVA